MNTRTIKKILACIAVTIAFYWVCVFGDDLSFPFVGIPLVVIMAAILEGDIKL